jgi:DNA-binding NtrC family response regulator
MASVLVVDDDVDIGRALVRMLTSRGYETIFAAGGQQALDVLAERHFDAVVTDLNMPQISGLDVLRFAKEKRAARAVVVATAYGTIDLAVEAMQLGACDFLTKPYAFARLEQTLKAALSSGDFRPAPNSQGWREKFAADVIGEDASLLRILTTIERISDVDSNVLVTGESGTGKEVMARVIHRSSGRGGGPFVAVNCAAIPEHLVESELFGHAKGAFTGATGSKIGHFQAADKGTLFLDEIGEMPLDMQAKMLRAIQEREITPVGEVKPHKVDVRIIAATNRELKISVERKEFREDLFFRLNVIPLKLPSLRERASDIPVLAQRVVQRVNANAGRHVSGISAEAMQALVRHPWPGNVRELENLVERMVVLKGEGELTCDDMPELMAAAQVAPSSTAAAQTFDFNRPAGFKSAVEDYEMSIISAALNQTQGNQKKAAELLGIHRTTLVEKLRRRQNS